MADTAFIVSCEHASAHVPRTYRRWLSGKARDHTAYDLGALRYAKALARAFGAPLFSAGVSRLLVDANRSLHHPHLFGAALCDAPALVKQRLLDNFYLPHRQGIQHAIDHAHTQKCRVVHFAAHSFAPVLRGEVRQAEIGLLYDPRRPSEKAYAARWQAALQASAQQWRIRRNYPYRGAADGLPTALRQHYADTAYLGFEIEINQAVLRASPARLREFHAWFVRTTREVFLAAEA